VFHRWKNIKRLAHKEGGSQGDVQVSGYFMKVCSPFISVGGSVGIETHHLKACGTRILYEEDRRNEMHSELFAILEQAKQDAIGLAPIITNLESYQKDV
jgi:hypothetical protein